MELMLEDYLPKLKPRYLLPLSVKCIPNSETSIQFSDIIYLFTEKIRRVDKVGVLQSGEPATKDARVGTKFERARREVAKCFGGGVKTQAASATQRK